MPEHIGIVREKCSLLGRDICHERFMHLVTLQFEGHIDTGPDADFSERNSLRYIAGADRDAVLTGIVS
jgi:hypothetical protein